MSPADAAAKIACCSQCQHALGGSGTFTVRSNKVQQHVFHVGGLGGPARWRVTGQPLLLTQWLMYARYRDSDH